MKNILLSVIIPTKDRYATLIPVIKALLKYIESDEIEFIIQDNSEVKIDLQDVLLDTRVIYDYISHPMSIKENTSEAIRKIRGEFTIFIGDDDLLSPDIISIVKLMKDKEMDCLVYNAAYYWWSSVDFVKESFYHRKKAFWTTTTLNFEFVKKDSNKELNYVLLNGGVGMFGLARYYHGIIRSSLLKEVKKVTGEYLNGSSPDMGFAISLNLVLESYYYIDFPISVYGASKNSGGGWTASKKHYGNISEQKHLPKNINELWDEKIPYVWSEVSIYGQTVSEILRQFNSKEKINYNALYSTMLALEPYLFSYIAPKLFKHILIKPSSIIPIMVLFVKRKIGSYKREYKYRNKRMNYNVCLLEDVDLVMDYMKNNIKFSNK